MTIVMSYAGTMHERTGWAGRCGIAELRFAALMAALVVYGLFGLPTPDGFGPAECIVGLLLLIGAGSAAAGAFVLPRTAPLWRAGAWLLLVYGLIVPTVAGIAAGHDAGLIVRDIVPFIFLTLPLFLAPLLQARPHFKKGVALAAAFCGLSFALRLLVPSFIDHGRAGFSALPDIDPHTLANAPTVLFMSMAGIGFAARGLMRGDTRLAALPVLAVMALSAGMGVLAMAAVMQRASLGLAAAALVLLWIIAAVRRPLGALIPLAAASVVLVLFYDPVAGLAQHLWMKTVTVGFNNRAQEASAVFALVGDSLPHALFGRGWGQTVTSPAVGDATVNYTHTILTALWLKTGLLGVAAAGVYCAGLLRCLWRIAWRNPVLACALGLPFLIDITLYASYKSLDFGIILLLIAAWGQRGQEKEEVLPERRGLLYAKRLS